MEQNFPLLNSDKISNPEMLKSLGKTASTLIVLAAPSVLNTYYANHLKDIIEFQKNLVENILKNTSDRVLVFADEITHEKFSKEFPAKTMRKFEFTDIWIRDFSSIGELHFKYSTSYDNDVEAPVTWLDFAKQTQLSIECQKYQLDGGNVVHNGKDKLIVTRRFLEDNKIKSIEEGISILQSLFKSFREFAIIPYDDPVLGHADGMVSFIDENVLLLMKFDEGKLLNKIRKILREVFTGLKIVEIEAEYSMKKEKGFYSAHGCYANILTTDETLYVPVFGMKQDEQVLKVIKENTTKKVVAIDCQKVSVLGGNVRCLTWEVKGENAEKILSWND